MVLIRESGAKLLSIPCQCARSHLFLIRKRNVWTRARTFQKSPGSNALRFCAKHRFTFTAVGLLTWSDLDRTSILYLTGALIPWTTTQLGASSVWPIARKVQVWQAVCRLAR